MKLRFAILKMQDGGEEQIVLEYRSDQVRERLKIRTRENLSAKETAFKHSFSKDEVEAAVDKAFLDLEAEFKEQTVRLI